MPHFEQQADASVAIEIAGRTYRFAALRYCDHAAAAARIRTGRRKPLDVARQLGRTLDKQQQEHLLALAYRDLRRGEPVELAEVLAWYRTPEGTLFRRWLMLQRHHPELTLKDVDALLAAGTADQHAQVQATAVQADGLPPGTDSRACAALDLDWRRVFRELSERLGWTPAEIAALSIAQIMDYWTPSPSSPAGSVAEAVTTARAAQQRRSAWIKQMQQRIFDARS